MGLNALSRDDNDFINLMFVEQAAKAKAEIKNNNVSKKVAADKENENFTPIRVAETEVQPKSALQKPLQTKIDQRFDKTKSN